MIMLPSPANVCPLEPDEFIGAYEYAVMVAQYELLEEIAGIGKPFLVTDVGLLELTNVFDNRFGLAAARHFSNEKQSFMWRVLALLQLLEAPFNEEVHKREQRRL